MNIKYNFMERKTAKMKQNLSRGENILEQLSRTRFFTGFESPTLFSGAT